MKCLTQRKVAAIKKSIIEQRCDVSRHLEIYLEIRCF